MLIDVRGYSTYMKNCEEIFQGIPSNPLQACFCCIISNYVFYVYDFVLGLYKVLY